MRLPLAAAFVVALALRLGFGLLYWVDKPLTHDEREYLLLARNIARGQGFGYPTPLVQLPPSLKLRRTAEALAEAGRRGLARALATADATDTPVDGERFGRAPIYPLFLAGVMTMAGAA
ncbi:MAG: hypothetical protein HYS05_13610, partial [Acidobacteria bacterium]|nr:hypothetical protein [Acidobacteriota bacterium]